MDVSVKHEIVEQTPVKYRATLPSSSQAPIEVIDLSSSSSSSSDESDSDDSDDSQDEQVGNKRSRACSNGGGGASSNKSKKKKKKLDIVLPVGFLDPLPAVEPSSLLLSNEKSSSSCQKQQPAPPSSSYSNRNNRPLNPTVKGSRQFWKAGDYEGDAITESYASSSTGGMDHVRVHPKFLHSNATSHKWALGAFAELLDNALDETCNGATFARIDVLENRKDKSRMLLIEDNGGGMDPDKMRQCMSLGYSAKSKIANTIGQYGNGFKTSTMRLGADVIVFSRSRGKDGKSSTQSIGLLSYTFLRSTGKEDIVVPMLDYEKEGREWHKLIRSSPDDWNRNVETIIDWSPYSNEAELLHQFDLMKDQGTCVVIYNLWDNDQGQLELDFDTDRHDIQIGGVNRDEKKIEMAKHFPNSRHFLTYQHSLRSYASILYLRLPPGFRIVLRGKDVEHHNLVNDMMQTQEVTYRPVAGIDGVPKDPNVVAVVTMGFVKDAKDHIDVQGFNVFHKNRLIKPFWRVWNSSGSDGRGVIGVLEANFVEPAHDKQGFERTTVLSRLEARLVILQKQYWSRNCYKIGYAPRHRISEIEKSSHPRLSPNYFGKRTSALYTKAGETKHGNRSGSSEPASLVGEDDSDSEMQSVPSKGRKSSQNSEDSEFDQNHASNGKADRTPQSQAKDANGNVQSHYVDLPALNQLKVENHELKDRLKTMEESLSQDLEFERDRRKLLEALVSGKSSTNSDAAGLKQLELENHELKDRLKKIEESFSRDLQHEKDRCKLLEAKLKESEQKIEEMNNEQESLIDLFAEERSRKEKEEENLRKKLKDASNTIQELLDKVRLLERMKSINYKS